MHELSLCRTILDTINNTLRQTTYTQIKEIHLKIGVLALIDVSSLEFYFNVVSKGTLAENAKIKITMVSAKAYCECCQQECIITKRCESCSHCNQILFNILEGDKLYLEGMEVV